MRRIGAVLGMLGLVATVVAPLAWSASPLVVVVHPQRDTPLDLEDIANIFLKKRRFWPDGESIVALNLQSGDARRELFSQRVLGADSARLATYWNQQYFQGVFPPVTLSSSAAVKRYVAADRNAIGYIDASEADDSVRVVLRLE